MSTGAAISMGVLGTIVVLMIFYLARTIYRQGNEWAKFQIKRIYYRIKFRAHWKDCITCEGKGSYSYSGGIEGVGNTLVGGQQLEWECGYCLGTGKEKASYTYRFGWLMRLLRIYKTPIEFENDQQEAEKVLGDARARLSTATGIKPTEQGGDR